MSETTPKEQRGPTNLRIKFRSATLEQFIERYAADVSVGGIFIRTREPLAIGTQLRLELQLQDGMALLAGEGTVIWIREADPARPTVPPGMAVRFDKVSEETQPTLDRILAEKARREAAGVVPAPPGSGMAVRRQSSVLAPLESSGRVSDPASSAPTARVDARAAAAVGERPTGAAGPAATKTAFLGSRTAPAAGTPATQGPFTRARQTSTRPVPVPSALFEPPTAADIDKALSILEEAPGPAPMPQMPSVPRFVAETEDISNDPTRVADSASAAAEAATGDAPLPSLPEPGAEPSAANLASGGGAVAGGTGSPEKAAVPGPATPDVSRRFRAASRAYPTLNRRRGAGVVVALIVVLGAAGAVIWKLRPGSAVPPHPVTTSAATIAPEAPPAAAPSPPPPPPAEPAIPAPAPAVAAAPPAEKPVAEKPAEKPSAEERPSSHRGSRHKAHDEGASARAAVAEAAAPPAEKPAEPKSAESKPTEEKPAGDKPAAPEAAAPAAETKPAGAILKVTSTPPGADVSIDGSPVGMTPFTSRDIDPGSPHSITLKKDGFESHERMVGASDWSRPHGSTPPGLKVNVKLRRIAPPPGAETPKETGAPAEDTGGPYIKEVNPSTP